MPQFLAEGDSGVDNDHQIRLKKCQQFFIELSEFTTENLLVIISYLHDTWSVVRNQCSKLLTEKAAQLSPEIVYQLVKTFSEFCKSGTSWQEVHGSLLGFNAIVCGRPQVDGNTYHHIESVCLSLISHVSTPVREASRSCLFNIQKKVNDQHNFVFKLIFLISSILKSNHSASESSTLTLDGILGCLVDSFQEFPNLIIQFDVPFLNLIDQSTKDVDEFSRINQPTVEFIDTIKACMLHEASSVRQKAGQVLIILMTNLLNGSHFISGEPSPKLIPVLQRSSSNHATFSSTLIDYIVSRVLIESLKSTRRDDWRLQEICLMVSEEVLSLSLKNKINELRSGLDASIGIVGIVIQLVKFLKQHLGYILCHESFEVRRMATQILPLLARIAVLYESPSACPVISGIDVSSVVFTSRPTSGLYPSLRASRDELDGIDARSSSSHSSRGTPTKAVTPTKHFLTPTPIITFAEGPVEFGDENAAVTSMDTHEARSLANLIRVMWLSEVIKQNQHLLDVCPPHLWEMLKNSPFQLSNFGANGSSISSNVMLSWEPLDCWSLEVPGRLFEIDNRTKFQKDIRNLLNESVNSNGEGSTVQNVVASKVKTNIQSILAGIEEVLEVCESVYFTDANGADDSDESDIEENDIYLYGSLGSIGGYQSSSVQVKNNKIQIKKLNILLSNDFIECNMLIVSFLTSIMLKFGDAPDAASFTNNTLLQPVSEYLGRSKQLLSCWTFHTYRINCMVDSSVSKAINLNAVSAENSSAHTSLRLKPTRSFLTSLQRREKFCDCCAATNEEGNECKPVSRRPIRSFDHLTLMPSLSDPSTNPLNFLESHSSQRVIPVYTNSYSKPNTPASTHTKSIPTSASSGSALIVPTPYGASKTVLIGSSGYMSMNRWNCEATSPLLSCLTRLTLNFHDSFQLCQILVEWIIACQLNSLWLDCKTFSKKNLFESLSVLVVNATADAEWNTTTCCNNQFHFYSAQLLRGLAESLSLRPSVCLEVKQVNILIKACVVLTTTLLNFTVDSVEDGITTVGHSCQLEIAQFIKDSIPILQAACDYYEQKFAEREGTRSTHHSIARLESVDLEDIPQDNLNNENEDDEFSDWDESSSVESEVAPLKSQESTANISDFNKSTLTDSLMSEMIVLRGICSQILYK